MRPFSFGKNNADGNHRVALSDEGYHRGTGDGIGNGKNEYHRWIMVIASFLWGSRYVVKLQILENTDIVITDNLALFFANVAYRIS